MPIWTAYSRKQKRVIEYEASNEGIESCYRIIGKAKGQAKKVKMFYSDANSCYRETFKKYYEKDKLKITKAETHRIESSNSSIRDNLARFNRKTKRYTKSLSMLNITLNLFFNRHLIEQAKRLFLGGKWFWGEPLFH